MIIIERFCRCAKFYLTIPETKRSEFLKQFKENFPEGKLDKDNIVSIELKNEDIFKDFLKQFNGQK